VSGREKVYAVANMFGVSRVMRYVRRRGILILMYHGVVEDEAPFRRWTHLSESKFAWQMQWLRGRYQILPLQRVIAAMRDGTSLPDNTAVVTFDDGLRNNYSRAFPILRELGIPATVFLSTAFMDTDEVATSSRIFLAFRSTTEQRVDLSDLGLGALAFETTAQRDAMGDRVRLHAKQLPIEDCRALVATLEARLKVDPACYPDFADEFRMMTWGQALEMQRSGLIEFGAHGAHHEILSRLPENRMRSEIADSCDDVRRRLGVADVAFAYPNGLRQDFSPAAKVALKDAAAICGLSTIPGLCTVRDDVFELKRVGVGDDVGRNRFAVMCWGLEAR